MAGEFPTPGEPAEKGRITGKRRNTVTARLLDRLDHIVTVGGPVPTLDEFSAETGYHPSSISKIIRRSGYQARLQELRELSKEPREDLFPHTPEVAWFLGMLVGNSGSVEAEAKVITFTNNNSYKRDAFRQSGESILGEKKRDIQGFVDSRRERVTSSVSFYSTPHVKALGDFRKRQKPDTVRERHGWVLEEPFIDSFVSGVFDSSGILAVRRTINQVDFYTNFREVADFYRLMLLRIGITGSIDIPGATPEREVLGIRIGNQKDIKVFAQKVTSVDPEIQQKLDVLKGAEKKKRRLSNPQSAVEIVEEWRRLTRVVLGHTPSSSDIHWLRRKNQDPQTLFPVSVYVKYFGAIAGTDRHTFSAAQKFLERLITLESFDLQQAVANIQERLDRDNQKSRFRIPQEKQVYP